MNIVATTDRNYSADLTPVKMKCLYKMAVVKDLKIDCVDDAKRILEIWSQLDVSPFEAMQLHEASKDIVGIEIQGLMFSMDRQKVLYRSKVIGLAGLSSRP